MPQWDTTIAFVGLLLTLVFSIITPAITTALTNRFQLRLKQTESRQNELDRKFSKKANIYESSLETVGRYIHYADQENASSLGAYLYQLYLYLPAEHWQLLDSLTDTLAKKKFEDSNAQLIALSKVLSNELSKTEPIDMYNKRNYRKYCKSFAHNKIDKPKRT